jgi:hypothetical protein
LKNFAGSWQSYQPERLDKQLIARFYETLHYTSLQFHFRCFSADPLALIRDLKGKIYGEGLFLNRKYANLQSIHTEKKTCLLECRLSLHLVTRVDYSASTTKIRNDDPFPRFAVVMLADDFPNLPNYSSRLITCERTSSRLKICGPSSGFAMFQHFVDLGIDDFWEPHWNMVLNAIDECLSIEVRVIEIPPFL